MLKFLLFFIVLIFSLDSTAQSADFILLKKKDKTIKSFYSGTNIEFVTKNGVYKNGTVSKIENDTLFIQEFLVSRRMTNLGVYIIDTAGSFHFSYHYNDIKSIGKEKNNFDMRASGSSLLGGGILLTLLSGVVYLTDRQRFSPELLAASVTLGTMGFFMSTKKDNGIVIGKKKYHLEYIKIK